MINQQFMESCFCCNSQFNFSHGKYRGRNVIGYEIMICDVCWEANWDGWSPNIEGKLIEHLEKHKIPIPARNTQLWLPREYS